MKNKWSKVVLCMLFLVMGNVFAADDEDEGNNLVKVLPWVGKPSKDMPKKIILGKESLIVAIGDSITMQGGYLRDCDAALIGLYSDLQIPIIKNAGISGQKAENFILRFQKDVIDRKPAVVTINVGINDVWHRLKAPHDEKVLAAYKENVEKMVEMAQKNNIKVLLLTPTVFNEDPGTEGNKRLLLYCDAMKSIAKKKQCILVDLHSMFLEALKHKPAGAKDYWLTKDGVHMKPLGDAIMAIGVLRGLGVSDKEIASLK
ncbi:MAG: hypothetical protein A2231_12580 [Candidatus Firestonebacteria bacterium RIFOXYA2_FULL_40_8]|nr:MAG: hypothetical protein A2231_12580 [Candidatus Firestonebacteria bacterium RIFOXYA2_FULL_40_8]